MLGLLKMCYTCLEMNNQELIDVSTLDFDSTTFLYKLQICVSSELEEENSKLMCSACIKQLRMSYKFREMVLVSQEVLTKRKTELVSDTHPSDLSYKIDIDGQFFESECLMVKNDSQDLGLRLTHKNENIEYCFSNDIKDECAHIGNDIKDINLSDEVEQHKNCNEKSWGIDQHMCAGYSSDEETKEVKLKGRRGRTKKQKAYEPDTTYECYHCSTVFNKRLKLQKHISRVHTDGKKYICSYCEKGFKQSYHLREHLTSHTGERNYTCSICDKTFQRISSMRRHIRSHERAPGEKTKKTPFLCTVCGKNFPFSNGVQRHMRIHLGIKNHECSICQRRFTQSTHLHVHMRTHTGEKPYICDTCGEAFSLNAGLQKHMTIHKASDNILDDMFPKNTVQII
ncbi:hypothetical protein RN001_007446 [Aquatica leii]|uniref:Uncharacterized protein n=1 Tax=Aquatica leii TaxID=1421715 RepID=A0AAN7SQX5_9COLE|nr:hypothetical protein RN001_007446 [Aquatica leii]